MFVGYDEGKGKDQTVIIVISKSRQASKRVGFTQMYGDTLSGRYPNTGNYSQLEARIIAEWRTARFFLTEEERDQARLLAYLKGKSFRKRERTHLKPEGWALNRDGALEPFRRAPKVRNTGRA